MLGQGLAENTHRKRAAIVKQFFKAAISHKLIRENPCTGLKCRLIVVEDRQRLISLADIQRVLDYCDPELRALVCLSRFAALRCPSESTQLRWSDLNRMENKFVVRSPKTEHHGKGYRLVPLVPEVLSALDVLWGRLPEGASDLVFPRFAGCSGVAAIIRKHLKRAFSRAGLDFPPKPWHNMRASCINEWVELFPSHVVCSWAGHSEAVSQKHYRQTTDQHFSIVTSQVSRLENRGQNRVQQPAASDRNGLQEDSDPTPNPLIFQTLATSDELLQEVKYTRRDLNPQPTVPKTVALSN